MFSPKKILSLIMAVVTSATFVGCKPKEKLPENLQARADYIEHLEEKYKDYEEVPYGLDITLKTDLVGICYSTWFTAILGSSKKDPPDNSVILSKENPKWTKFYQFHWWAKPALGYYRSDDKEVIRTHMTQLAEMGADYIIIDNTNALASWKISSDWENYITIPCTALLDTIVEMRAEGLETPYVVFWSHTTDEANEETYDVINATYEEFISQEKWRDCFVYWEGKPFMLTTSELSSWDTPKYELTTRVQWGLNDTSTGNWTFLQVENPPVHDEDGFVEQTCVAAAAQETYMNISTAHGRNHGIFMYEQWNNAFQYRPKAITITWWNEWAAQCFKDEDTGEPLFVDNYNQEFSRDIEPMEGGHGDQYYQWTKQYIAAYKALEETCPVLVEEGYETQVSTAGQNDAGAES